MSTPGKRRAATGAETPNFEPTSAPTPTFPEVQLPGSFLFVESVAPPSHFIVARKEGMRFVKDMGASILKIGEEESVAILIESAAASAVANFHSIESVRA